MSLWLVTGRATASLRRLTARHGWIRWLPVIGCGIGLITSAHLYTAQADSTREAWGPRRTAWIATGDIAPGAAIDAERVELPAAAVPDSAVDDGSPVGKVAIQRIGDGELLTATDVGRAGPMSLLPAGWRAVAITELPASGAAPGDQVDVVSEGVVLVADAVVIEQLDDAIVVGAPAELAPLVALANETGVALLRSGRTGSPPG